jgi:hypothetical protein
MAFLLHGPSDGRPGAVEPGHDRALLDPKGPGHVFIGKTSVGPENEDFAELPGQGLDRRFQADETVFKIVRSPAVRGGDAVGSGIERIEPDQPASPVMVAADVPGQPEQPELDHFRTADGIQLAAGLDVNVLAEVLGDGGVTGESQTQQKDLLPVREKVLDPRSGCGIRHRLRLLL